MGDVSSPGEAGGAPSSQEGLNLSSGLLVFPSGDDELRTGGNLSHVSFSFPGTTVNGDLCVGLVVFA